jgi:methylthioribulose 1-phosphate dehydratase/enolase-phosphatase E1
MQAYELRGAGAVIHSHGMHALLATLLEPDSNEFKVTHLEMIKVGDTRAAREDWHDASRP